MRLEIQFWDALKDLAQREKCDISELCTRIARPARSANLSSAVRVAVMAYYRERAVGDAPANAAASIAE